MIGITSISHILDHSLTRCRLLMAFLTNAPLAPLNQLGWRLVGLHGENQSNNSGSYVR